MADSFALIVTDSCGYGWYLGCLRARHCGPTRWRHRTTLSETVQSIQVCGPTEVKQKLVNVLIKAQAGSCTWQLGSLLVYPHWLRATPSVWSETRYISHDVALPLF